jgi:hypothetical protein
LHDATLALSAAEEANRSAIMINLAAHWCRQTALLA